MYTPSNTDSVNDLIYFSGGKEEHEARYIARKAISLVISREMSQFLCILSLADNSSETIHALSGIYICNVLSKM